MPLQCLRNLAWLLTGEFYPGLEEPCSFGGVGCCGELCFSPCQSSPLHLHVSSLDCGGAWYNPPRSEVCLFSSLYCWGSSAEGPRQGVWGQIWAEWHLPLERSHSPSWLQDLTPCVAAVTSQVWLEWWCSVWAEAYAHSFRLEYSVL